MVGTNITPKIILLNVKSIIIYLPTKIKHNMSKTIDDL